MVNWEKEKREMLFHIKTPQTLPQKKKLPAFSTTTMPNLIFQKLKLSLGQSSSSSCTNNSIITLNVGGQIFQTTQQTLELAGPESFFSQLSGSTHPFIDRDPELFSIFLSLLRTGNLPSKVKSFHLQDLIEESKFYNIESLLINSLSNPSQFDPFNLEKSKLLPLSGRETPSAVAATPFGTLHVANGSKITSFDWSLQQKSTLLTQFTAIDSLLAISPTVAAAGADDFSGLQILDLEKGFVRQRLYWENVTKSGSMVQAIGSGAGYLFSSFESGRRNSNTIMVYDVNTFLPVVEIGHCEIFGADLDSGIPASKLRWVEAYGLVMAAGSHSGISGVLGNVRLWDVRSGNLVWEMKEKIDCFADITVSDNLRGIFKVGVNSGEVSFVDLRKLGENDQWTCLGHKRKVMNVQKEGFGCKIEAHGNHLFCTRRGNIELWSEVLMSGDLRSTEDGLSQMVFRNNLMGRMKDMEGGRITNLAFGGNKMFATRKDQQFVEVWATSVRG